MLFSCLDIIDNCIKTDRFIKPMAHRVEQQFSTVLNKVFTVMKMHAVAFGLEHHGVW
jgi:hypothetical protein